MPTSFPVPTWWYRLAEDNRNPRRDVPVTFDSSWLHARSESSLLVNPLDPDHIIAASKRFNDPATYDFTLASLVSRDGGNSWSESSPFALLSGWAGISDPALAWDDAGDAYLVGLPFPPPGGPDTLGICVYKSSDGGATWSAPKVIHSSTGDDKQWAAGDASPASPYKGRVYAVWDDGSDLRFARTTDHGVTWKGVGAEPAGSKLDSGSFSPEVSVGADGTIYVVYMNGQSGSQIRFVKSTDGGNSFSAPRVAATGITSLRGSLPLTDGWPHFPGSTFRVLSLATGCVSGNTVAFAWADGREKIAGQTASRIYYALSHDGGASFTTGASGNPLLSGVDPGVHHFHPQLAATPGGAIGCAFYEIGQKGPGPTTRPMIDVLVAASRDSGGSFPYLVTVTDQPWDPAVGAPLSHGDPNVTFIGEYFGFDASPRGFHALWTDTRTGMQELFASHVLLRTIFELGPTVLKGSYVDILFGIVSDGGGLGITPGGKPVPVPPRDPAFDIMKALVIDGLAASMGGRSGLELRRGAFAAIARTAQGQLGGAKGSEVRDLLEGIASTAEAAHRPSLAQADGHGVASADETP